MNIKWNTKWPDKENKAKISNKETTIERLKIYEDIMWI